ncbi:MAG: hypothetical protein M1826_000534 [Phylliscum demangeonii]|nr:MAG: hypothetical protein M1826_000534 [Phylliscum demangeonii]
MPSSCKDIRAALAECLQQSDCIMIQRHTAADCIREPLVNTLPTRCLQLRRGYGECKRGMVDMRKRFRGNYPVALSAELEGEGGVGAGVKQVKPTGQLYAGKPAMAPFVRVTDGSEDEEPRGGDGEGGKGEKGGGTGEA